MLQQGKWPVSVADLSFQPGVTVCVFAFLPYLDLYVFLLDPTPVPLHNYTFSTAASVIARLADVHLSFRGA